MSGSSRSRDVRQLAGVHYRLDTLTPKSDLTQRFYDIFVTVTVLDILILIVVVVVFFLALFVYSKRAGEPGDSSAKHHDVYLEMAWTIIPSIIVVAITVPTVRTIIKTQPDTWSPNTLEVRVIAHQWWWEFSIHLQVLSRRTKYIFRLTGRFISQMVSRDVIHSFFMPAIGGKRDVVPGQNNQITLTANTPGEYWGQCTEFCGDSHANMRFRVFVDTPEDFEAWTKHQLQDPVKPIRPARRRRAPRSSPTHHARYVIESRVSRDFLRNILMVSGVPI